MYIVSSKSERATWGPLVELTWNDPPADVSDTFDRLIKICKTLENETVVIW